MIIAQRKTVEQPSPPAPRQFHLRTLLVWVSAAAVIVAACTGVFGDIIQVLATVLVAFVVVPIAATIVVGVLWIGLIWCCQQLANLLGRLNHD